MKALLFVCATLFSLSLFANAQIDIKQIEELKTRPWPRVTTFLNSVEVSIVNYDNNRSYRCSGSVWMNLESGRSRSEYVSLIVYPRSTAFRRIYNYNSNDRIRSASHSISCF